MRLIIVILLVSIVSTQASQWYVAINGTSGGTGTIGDPLTIAKAIGGTSPASPGDIIWLRGGSYSIGALDASVAGNSSNYITIQQYPLERSVLDGTLTSSGNYQKLVGFEIWNSLSINRTNSDALGPGLNLTGMGSKAINLVIHDTGAPGIFWPASAGGSGTEIYGCVIWGCGLYQTNGGFSGTPRGPNIYAQSTNGTRIVEDNIVSKSWTEGIKAYGEASSAEGFIFTNNICFYNYLEGFLVDTTSNPITNFWMTANVSFLNAYDHIGISSDVQQKSAIVSGNTFISDSPSFHNQLQAHGWTNFVMTNNVFVETTTNRSGFPNGADTMIFSQVWATNAVQTYTINSDQYWNGNDSAGFGHWYTNNGTRLRWSDFQSMGFEASGANHDNTLPGTLTVQVRPNKYQTGRANVTVLNWNGSTTANVNLSTVGLVNGQAYQILDSQNWLGTPITTGIYNSFSPFVSVSLVSTNVTALSGSQSHFMHNPNVHTPSTFNSFVVVPGAVSFVNISRVRELHVGNVKKPGTTPADLPGYFIDYVGGNDSNAGTNQLVPWKRHPYMRGFSGSYTHHGGDKFYFKGGVTWPNTCFQMTLIAGGSSAASNDIYGTYPLGWGSGKAIFDLENKYVTNSAGVGNQNSAAILFDGYNFPSGAGISFITLTNLDIKRFKQHHTGLQFGEAAILKRGHSASNIVVNCWIRDWDMDLITATGQDGGDVAGIGEKDYITYQGGWVIDGCMFTQSGSLQRTAGAIHGWFTVTNCLITDVCNGLFGTVYAYNNIISNIVGATDSSTHENAIYAQFPSVISGNLVHDLDSGASAIYLAPNVNYATNINYTVFNNVVWNCGAQEPISVDQETTIAGGVRIYNNTLVNGGSSCIRIGTKSHIGSIDIKGNHLITSNANPISFNPAFIDSTLVNLSNIVQTPASATPQGYVIGNRFAPTSGINATVGLGTNLSGTFTIDRLGVSRSDPWDAGAYQYNPPAFSDIISMHTNGSSTLYTAVADTDVARGSALKSATTNAIAGDLIYLKGKVFDCGTNVLFLNTVSPGISLIGSGRTSTEIKTQYHFTNTSTAFANVGNSTVIRDLTITDRAGVGVYSFPVGIFHGPSFTGLTLRRLAINGNSDCLYMVSTNACSGNFYDLILTANYDCYNVGGPSSSYNLYNCLSTSTATIASGFPDHGFGATLDEGTFNLYNCTLIGKDGASDNFGVNCNGGTVNIYQGTASATGTGACDLIVEPFTGGVINVQTGTVYSTTCGSPINVIP